MTVIQRTAAEHLRNLAVASRQKTLKIETASVALYTQGVKKAVDPEVKERFARNLEWAKQSVDRIKRELEELKGIIQYSDWVSYQVTCLLRKKFQREMNRVADCRSYQGQPARDMRAA